MSQAIQSTIAASFFIFINKPVGITSQQCLSRFKREFGFKKAGHHGTLDPFATGLLLVGVGEATKFFQFVDDSQKTYQAVIQMGARTDTLDRTGQIVAEMSVPVLTKDLIDAVLKKMTGQSLQTPPMYSAVKVAGKKLYELARKGEEVERAAREIEIFNLKLIDYSNGRLKIRATVSRGTYIRVLAEDISAALGTCGHLIELERTELCGHDLNNALTFDHPEDFVTKKIAISQMLAGLQVVELDSRQQRDLFFGREVILDQSKFPMLSSPLSDPIIVTLSSQGQFLGIGELIHDRIKSLRLIHQNQSEL